MITDRASQFFINGEWVDASDRAKMDVINPASEAAVCQVSLGNESDVDRAVAAARAAFPSYSQTTREQRIELLKRPGAISEMVCHPGTYKADLEKPGSCDRFVEFTFLRSDEFGNLLNEANVELTTFWTV